MYGLPYDYRFIMHILANPRNGIPLAEDQISLDFTCFPLIVIVIKVLEYTYTIMILLLHTRKQN